MRVHLIRSMGVSSSSLEEPVSNLLGSLELHALMTYSCGILMPLSSRQ